MQDATSPTFPREIVELGLRFHPLTKAELLDEIFRPRPPGTRIVLGGANLHGLYVTHVDPAYDRLLARPDTLVILDGMPLVWMLRARGHKVERAHRTTWVDWLTDSFERAAREGKGVFVLGHAPEVLETGLALARARWPSLRIDGHHGFFDMTAGSAELEAVLARIAAAEPHFLVVGMGMPRQERFVDAYRERLAVPVVGLGGAAFAYFAGFEPTPPRWMGRWGLEWLHRLAADPRRMAHRYLLEPPLLAGHLARRAWTQRPQSP
ncbi:WecB/TagA/CpsF family glycosyltransferase [Aureimonas ureilytica]|uniref:WecB/TagA/CpsF family glycosyltransferase n=1 Tax=Aureimonas ureilytica TaxID=401562 RepID=UPI000734C4F0|nr:WecB/TagA/CpsF family glycosyltransferase [Aureimonas ureilytica]